ncbi:uncharacterized protein LOC123512656 [Portunus trituberculatus]|uniref:uncharacterized protein LOC123512656 n=1 Tax=Portunus trituberculatus TaxID=210409 RepID=UPI001E1D0434|nr:uncharacterized protein LOC123512656 [Portunus trituberculatus]XP_045125067.1 uncharacterized protein LOC123512656 [Portunus trituberculatus]
MTGWWCTLLLLVVEVMGTGPPSDFVGRLNALDFTDGNYYIMARDGMTASLDDLQRGQDGLIIKLNNVIRTLKEDALKLNNIFYKLGRHDTNLEDVDSNLHRLGDSSRRTEAKLNKHAYNVDFLRRRVEDLHGQWQGVAGVQMEMAAVRSITDRLDDRLTDAIARLGLVENTTKTLEKRSTPGHLDVFQAAERPPTLTVYPYPTRDSCRLDFERVGSDCYWFGGEELTFTEATAACFGHGGSLLTLPSPGTQLTLLLNRLKKDTLYWTGGTDAFRHGYWVYLMTAQPVMPLHWAGENASNPRSVDNQPDSDIQHCAGLTSHGLTPRPCTQRHPYICHVM